MSEDVTISNVSYLDSKIKDLGTRKVLFYLRLHYWGAVKCSELPDSKENKLYYRNLANQYLLEWKRVIKEDVKL